MDYQRQLDLLNPREILFSITLIGCGGIGSPTALMLSKVGWPKLVLVDPDKIESHNLPNQLFPASSIGEYKVDACRRIVSEFAPSCSVKTIKDKFRQEHCDFGLIVSGVDSMKSRQEIWEVVRSNTKVPLYIDARIGAEIVQIFSVKPCSISDVTRYEKYLYDDDETEPLPCTARAIMYTGFFVAGLIGAQLKKWVRQEPYNFLVTSDLKTQF